MVTDCGTGSPRHKTYLDDRAKRGFNAILVNLVEHQFSSHPRPMPLATSLFRSGRLQHWERTILIMRHGSLIRHQDEACSCFVPAYLGVNGGEQGWYSEAAAAGPAQMRAYGEAVARRFARYPNIVWVLGGDFDAPDKPLVSQLAEGIAAASPARFRPSMRAAIRPLSICGAGSAGSRWIRSIPMATFTRRYYSKAAAAGCR